MTFLFFYNKEILDKTILSYQTILIAWMKEILPCDKFLDSLNSMTKIHVAFTSLHLVYTLHDENPWEPKVICGVDVIATGLNIDFTIVSSTQEMTQFLSIFYGSCIVWLIVAGSYGEKSFNFWLFQFSQTYN